MVQKYLEQAKTSSADKPFFYVQHAPMANTVVGGASSYDGVVIPNQDSILRSHNCVVLTGHTHVPLTDERAIWQSNSKKAAQYTVVSCGTTHYSYLRDFSDLEINGDAHQTQQGLYMVVDGSQVSLERYSFTDLELTYADGVALINMSDVKLIGKPWMFDATQKNDRPYDYQTRVDHAQQPVFPEDAALEITDLTSDSFVITIPAATVGAPKGFSDLVQSYYVEVVNTATGETVTSKEIAAPYHIDTDPVRLNQAVTIKLTGFIPGAEYTVYAYARECYQKLSEPLSAQIITLE